MKKNQKILVGALLAVIVAVLVGGIIYVVRAKLNDKSKPVTKTEEKKPVEDMTIKIDIDDYEDILEKESQFLVYISKTGCGACQTFEPTLNEVLYDQGLKAYKLDLADFEKKDFGTFEKYFEISGTPTLALVQDKKVAQMLVGNKDFTTTVMWVRAYYEK